MNQINIFVKDKGPWMEDCITVQRFELDDEEKELVWCNHAGAVESEYEYEINTPGGYFEKSDLYLECKCGAWRLAYDDDWHESPTEGVRHGL